MLHSTLTLAASSEKLSTKTEDIPALLGWRQVDSKKKSNTKFYRTNIVLISDSDLCVNGNMEGEYDENIENDVNCDINGKIVGDIIGTINGHMNGEIKGNLFGEISGDINGDFEGDCIGGTIGGSITGSFNGKLINCVVKGSILGFKGNLEIISSHVNGGICCHQGTVKVTSSRVELFDPDIMGPKDLIICDNKFIDKCDFCLYEFKTGDDSGESCHVIIHPK